MLGRIGGAQFRHLGISSTACAAPLAVAIRQRNHVTNRFLCSAPAASSSVPLGLSPAADGPELGEAKQRGTSPAVSNVSESDPLAADVTRSPSSATIPAVPNEPASTLDVWYDFLKVLHAQGDFEDPDTSCDILVQQHNDVKSALLSFARRRPDILFSLPPLEVAALAEAELLPRDRPDRKLRNADRRLKDTFVTGRTSVAAATAAAAGTATGKGNKEVAGVAAGGGAAHASLQDLMRVLWDWAVAPEATVGAAAPALTPVLRHVLRCIRQLAVSEPDPAALERAQRLGTPTASELVEMQATTASAEDRRQAKATAFLERRHRLRLRDTAEGGSIVEAGDWFCANCGAVNWRDRPRCFRCAAPVDARGNTVVTVQDVAELYGDKPPRRRPRVATAAADADAIYEAQAAAASAAADAAAARSPPPPPASTAAAAAASTGARASRRAPIQLTEAEDDGGDEIVDLRSGRGPSRARTGSRDRPQDQRGEKRLEGRPGLRRRVAEAEGGEGEEEGDVWDEDADAPSTSEIRSSRAYQRNLGDFYSQEQGRQRPPRGRRPAQYDDDGAGADGMYGDDGDDGDYRLPARGSGRRGGFDDGDGAAGGGGGGRGGGRGGGSGGGGRGGLGTSRSKDLLEVGTEEGFSGGRYGGGGAGRGGDDDYDYEDLSFDAWEASTGRSRRGASYGKGRTAKGGDDDGEAFAVEGGGRGGAVRGRSRGGGGRGGWQQVEVEEVKAAGWAGGRGGEAEDDGDGEIFTRRRDRREGRGRGGGGGDGGRGRRGEGYGGDRPEGQREPPAIGGRRSGGGRGRGGSRRGGDDW